MLNKTPDSNQKGLLPPGLTFRLGRLVGYVLYLPAKLAEGWRLGRKRR
jgi:hypothetical protein